MFQCEFLYLVEALLQNTFENGKLVYFLLRKLPQQSHFQYGKPKVIYFKTTFWSRTCFRSTNFNFSLMTICSANLGIMNGILRPKIILWEKSKYPLVHFLATHQQVQHLCSKGKTGPKKVVNVPRIENSHLRCSSNISL